MKYIVKNEFYHLSWYKHNVWEILNNLKTDSGFWRFLINENYLEEFKEEKIFKIWDKVKIWCIYGIITWYDIDCGTFFINKWWYNVEDIEKATQEQINHFFN